ncbi:MAG: glycosyltransferase [Bacteroidetes bacterium]|nr:glycosyltransferase [Bacteroidota bacterium]
MDAHLLPKIPGKPRILVAPLDWGLGHATRCIPIIRELLTRGADVWLAGEGAQELLLKTEFPDLPFIPLPGYRMRYAKTSRGLLWKMIQQAPKMKRAIHAEHAWLQKMVEIHQLDVVISDNRYGLYHSTIPSVFITHQLLIKSPFGNWSEKILQHQNYRYIHRFTHCWVPDDPGSDNLAGELSHPTKMPSIPVSYTGPLSRLCITEKEEKNKSAISGKLLVILSGPEPQRSLLEDKLLNDIAHYNGPATIVRGLPGEQTIIPSTNMIRVYNHLPAAALLEEFASAEWVISRSGYSTVMDLMALRKKSILIATPGQTEQEYLSRYLSENKRAVAMDQESFTLEKILALAREFPYSFPPVGDTGYLKRAVDELFALLSHSPALG